MPFRASSTSSTTASCSCSSAPGRMRGRSPSTTGPDDDRFVAYVGSLIGIGTRRLPRPRLRCRTSPSSPLPASIAPQVKSARRGCAAASRASSTSEVEIERVRRQLARLRAVRPDGGSARATARSASTRCSARRPTASRTSSASASSPRPRAVPALPADAATLRDSGRPGLLLSRRPASNRTSSSPCRPALAPPVRLGRSGELGWTTWMAPNWSAEGRDGLLRDARFDPTERQRRDIAKHDRRTAARQANRGRTPWPTSALKP